MRKDLARQYFDFCHEAHIESKKHKALPFPDWIRGLKANRDTAQASHLSIQAAVLAIASNPDQDTRQFPIQGSLANFVQSLEVLCSVRWDSPNLTRHVLAGLVQTLRLSSGPDALTDPRNTAQAVSALHALATQAADRNAAAVTPSEVVQFMAQLAQAERLHAYALDGLGLIYSPTLGQSIRFVGDELRSGEEFAMPSPLEEAFRNAHVWFQPAEFANRAFLEVENLLQAAPPPADALLVNAARLDFPFYPEGNEDDELSETAGTLNACLKAGYKSVVVLVSNHYLTAGRGRAEKILLHCLRHGLIQIIQLPLGVLGLRSQAHSVMVFRPGSTHPSVIFTDLSDSSNRRSASKGFGKPRRAFELANTVSSSAANSFDLSVEALLDRCSGKKTPRRMVSFEVGQFSQKDPLSELRSTYQFTRLSECTDVFRSHHIVETGSSERAVYAEVGTSNITTEGQIVLGNLKDCASEALERRKAQILQDGDLLFCFRGAPESFGKVGIYRHQPGVVAVPNQSFVIIRQKPESNHQTVTPNLILWWLMSPYAQRYLEKKAITPDVMRIAPRDLAALEVPCGPIHLIDDELRALARAGLLAQKISEFRSEVAALLGSSWGRGTQKSDT